MPFNEDFLDKDLSFNALKILFLIFDIVLIDSEVWYRYYALSTTRRWWLVLVGAFSKYCEYWCTSMLKLESTTVHRSRGWLGRAGRGGAGAGQINRSWDQGRVWRPLPMWRLGPLATEAPSSESGSAKTAPDPATAPPGPASRCHETRAAWQPRDSRVTTASRGAWWRGHWRVICNSCITAIISYINNIINNHISYEWQ